ncbi:hypothetical protein [Burkholderia multivorans]|uniref:Uncharacterized protein n=1 Tax=Burkholderia multivorans TaxID=87883 RepID=A0AB37APF0_9BURK|nr:hypothetical protein [Burkholderia multivorans]MBU9589656.1 hypothetical protein [Burkholderia multivorans]PRE39271.1 hypothetical protein C6P97_30740 [Burkholderia multivorans]PRE42307.1 hypothetical protein C6P99_24865 [Burkholderia multivorans]
MLASKFFSLSVKASGAMLFAIGIAVVEMALIKIFGDGIGYSVLVTFIALAIVAWRRTAVDQAG